MATKVWGYCSWCHELGFHTLVESNTLRRNVYQCDKCKNFTLNCRVVGCCNMTRGKINPDSCGLNEEETSVFQKILVSISNNWDNELCAEHDGSIASFDKLSLQLNDLEEYKIIFEREKTNVQKTAAIAGGIAGGAVVFGLTAGIAAPGFASALGAAGVLGNASTGTAISTLSGAALTKASMAALGGGAKLAGGLSMGMNGGMFFISAAGAGLGATQGGAISNNYFGNVKDFCIKKVKDGREPAILFINGFLSQKEQDSSDWLKAVKKHYPNNGCYYVTWESKTNYDLGSLAVKGTGALAFKKFVQELAKRAARKSRSKLNPLNLASTISELVSNPWHTAMVKAGMTGVLLADIIPRVKGNKKLILMGHSLGSRVIFYTLNALATKKEKYISEVHLLGGAVDRTCLNDWQTAISAVNGNIYNYYTANDLVLKYLYQGANALLSNPIGLGEIKYQSKNIINVDVSDVVSGHMEYKDKFSLFLGNKTKDLRTNRL